MNIGSLFLSLGIKGDTKSLDDAIKKVEELKKQTQELNKALKETKSSTKLNISTGGTSGAKGLKESQVLREEAAVQAAKLRIAKAELGFLNLEEQARKKQEREREKADRAAHARIGKKTPEEEREERARRDKEKAEKQQEKEQKKREKDREKATKDFFNQIENGFSFVAKAFTGGLVAGGIGGYITAQASKQAALSASLQQYGIDPEKSQRFANVFRMASGGMVGIPETNEMIRTIQSKISKGRINDPRILLGLSAIGVDPTRVTDFESFIKEVRSAAKNPQYKEEDLTTLLEDYVGIAPEFAPAFGKNFSDKQFEDAYKNATILTNEQVKSARELNIKIAELGNSFDVLQGILIDKFAPTLINFIDSIQEKLNPESAEQATKYVGAGLGGLALMKGAKFAKRNPYIAAGLATYGAMEYLTGGNSVEGSLEFLKSPFQSLSEGAKVLLGKKQFGSLGNSQKKTSSYNYPDKATQDLLTRLDQGSVDSPLQRDLSLEEDARLKSMTSINPTNNITTNVTINAASVDKDTAPFIADKISGSVQKSILLDSKYPTLSVPQ